MKYKVGDKVRLKGTDVGGIIEDVIRGQYVVQIMVVQGELLGLKM